MVERVIEPLMHFIIALLRGRYRFRSLGGPVARADHLAPHLDSLQVSLAHRHPSKTVPSIRFQWERYAQGMPQAEARSPNRDTRAGSPTLLLGACERDSDEELENY